MQKLLQQHSIGSHTQIDQACGEMLKILEIVKFQFATEVKREKIYLLVEHLLFVSVIKNLFQPNPSKITIKDTATCK